VRPLFNEIPALHICIDPLYWYKYYTQVGFGNKSNTFRICGLPVWLTITFDTLVWQWS